MFVTSHVLLQLLIGTLSHTSYVNCVELFPFGNTSVWIKDESLQVIKLSRPLEFFDRKYNQLFVSYFKETSLPHSHLIKTCPGLEVIKLF